MADVSNETMEKVTLRGLIARMKERSMKKAYQADQVLPYLIMKLEEVLMWLERTDGVREAEAKVEYHQALPSLKRRGRPPKLTQKEPAADVSTAGASVPKRRGRPPKVRPDDEAQAAEKTPKRRGRPPKAKGPDAGIKAWKNLPPVKEVLMGLAGDKNYAHMMLD